MRQEDDLPSANRRQLLSAGASLAAAGSLLGCQASAAGAGRPADGPPDPEGAASRARDAERFATLSDQRGSVQPISSAERASRRQRLGRLLSAAGLDALWMEGGATMRYLSGVRWGHSERLFGLLVLADGSHFWIVPAFEAKRAELQIDAEGGPGGEIVTWDEHEYAFAPLAAALRERRAARVAVEPSLRHRFVAGLERELGRDAVSLGTDVVVELRGRKDAHELALLRRANELTQAAIVAASEHVRPGMTARDVSRLMRSAQERLGLQDVWVLALVGPDAAYPHGSNGNRKLERGDVILVDTGGSLHDYQSDNTRTWACEGVVSSELSKVWNVVRDAQKAGFAALRPGSTCASVDAAARAVIDAAGYGPGYTTFGHRLGHGIGMEGHEDPYLDGGSQVVLREGMTFSDEPGIYLYDRFGVRLEDIVVVSADGADHFGDWQKGPESPS